MTRVLFAAKSFGEISLEGEPKEIKRNIQNKFRKKKVYVPLEDIVLETSETPQILIDDMRKSCGKGEVYVWLPMHVKLPVFGDRIWEKCWKPKIKK